jgi:ABC-type dipeptide/oligopeptide/nickel transport system ATPase component
VLSAIYIKGFKTFARPVRMPLTGGVTAIVGPNGSGKSNVTDAVLFALGDQHLSEEEIVPDALEPGNQIVSYFERALCRIARLWGEAWRGNKHNASIIEQEVRPLLRLPLWHRRSTWDPGASLLISTERCSELYALLVDSVSQHGQEAVERLREAFEQQWNNTAAINWPNSIRRQVILALCARG